jgi:hypothetical protein
MGGGVFVSSPGAIGAANAEERVSAPLGKRRQVAAGERHAVDFGERIREETDLST